MTSKRRTEAPPARRRHRRRGRCRHRVVRIAYGPDEGDPLPVRGERRIDVVRCSVRELLHPRTVWSRGEEVRNGQSSPTRENTITPLGGAEARTDRGNTLRVAERGSGASRSRPIVAASTANASSPACTRRTRSRCERRAPAPRTTRHRPPGARPGGAGVSARHRPSTSFVTSVSCTASASTRCALARASELFTVPSVIPSAAATSAVLISSR